jgi:diguanylate cyclase (GGDEF)-like protein
LLAFLPALTLGGYWYGGEGVLLFMALVFPGVFALAGMFPKVHLSQVNARDAITGLRLQKSLLVAMDRTLSQEQSTGRTTACLIVEIDDFGSISTSYGAPAAEDLLREASQRLQDTLRDHDIVAKLEGAKFAVALAPLRRADLEALIQLSARIQAAIAEATMVDGIKVFVTASIGFCLPNRLPQRTGQAFLDAAQTALADAKTHGPASIRAFSGITPDRRPKNSINITEVADALENGQIRPWFQPQISTDTGEVSGFEALARWIHPERGTISPAEFLPTIREAGLFERLGEVILYHSLTALKTWEKAGFEVPNIGVNFSSVELGNPKLCEKIRWELDRFDLAPERLTIEILEDVIAQSENDTITRNIWALSEMGCGIDLDDFGTGHASIANIRRFAVDRIKIDRSYVTRVDVDRDQQSMVAAILTMAERLDLQTLAEGVETVGEYSMLSQLGCAHVQGFSIARPMPFEDTFSWMQKHRTALPDTPHVNRQAS